MTQRSRIPEGLPRVTACAVVVGGALMAVVARIWWYGFGVTCLPPLMGTQCRQVTPGRCQPLAPHTGQAPMPWPARTCRATAIC